MHAPVPMRGLYVFTGQFSQLVGTQSAAPAHTGSWLPASQVQSSGVVLAVLAVVIRLGQEEHVVVDAHSVTELHSR